MNLSFKNDDKNLQASIFLFYANYYIYRQLVKIYIEKKTPKLQITVIFCSGVN